MTDLYEISIIIGPCEKSEAESLCLELAEHLTGKTGELGSDLGPALSVSTHEDPELTATHCGDCNSELVGAVRHRYCPTCDAS